MYIHISVTVKCVKSICMKFIRFDKQMVYKMLQIFNALLFFNNVANIEKIVLVNIELESLKCLLMYNYDSCH